VGFGEVGEQTSDQVRRIGSRQSERATAELDRCGMFAAATPDSCEVAEDHRVDVGAGERLVHGERGLVVRDRTFVVVHRLVDRRNGVQDAALVDAVFGGPVHLEGPQTVIQGIRVVARLIVDDADQVQ
jgi:hypothetical protein